MLVYFVRHAQSQYNATWERLWWDKKDIALTQIWIKQAHLLWQRFYKLGIHFHKVYSSSTDRTIHSAQIILREMWDLQEIIIDDRVMEQSHWEWQGKKRIETFTDDIEEEKGKNPLWFSAPWWESIFMVQHRISDFFWNEALKQEQSPILVVTHSNTIRSLLWSLFLTNTFSPRLEISNTWITIFDWNNEILRIKCINNTSHLDLI